MHQHQRHCLRSLPDLWFAADKPLKHAVFKMQLGEPNPPLRGSLTRPDTGAADLTASLSDEHLLRILAVVPEPLRLPASLVCKRWLRLVGRLRRSLTLVDWSFLDRRRLYLRFPDITDLDLVPASLATSYDGSISRGSVLLSKGTVSVPVDIFSEPPVNNCSFFEPDAIDRGLVNVAHYYPGLQKLSLVAGSLEAGLMAVAQACDILQELDIHRCSDLTLRPISAFKNLQILRLVGSIEGLYHGPSVTDIGLTLLAHGCKRLVKLELVGCEGSYDGISAIGRCCEMLEELAISDHRMDAGWMAGLSFCRNLKTLSLHSCKRIDADPGPMEHLGTCPTIQTLQLQQCQLRDKRSLQALFMLCDAVRDVVFEKCWGLDNDMFSVANTCRNVKFLSLEGCSLLTTEGLESVVLSWIDLQRLVVISCNNIKDYEVSPALSNLFSVLKEFKWRPDSKSLRYTSLAGTGMGKKGGRFFKWA